MFDCSVRIIEKEVFICADVSDYLNTTIVTLTPVDDCGVPVGGHELKYQRVMCTDFYRRMTNSELEDHISDLISRALAFQYEKNVGVEKVSKYQKRVVEEKRDLDDKSGLGGSNPGGMA